MSEINPNPNQPKNRKQFGQETPPTNRYSHGQDF